MRRVQTPPPSLHPLSAVEQQSRHAHFGGLPPFLFPLNTSHSKFVLTSCRRSFRLQEANTEIWLYIQIYVYMCTLLCVFVCVPLCVCKWEKENQVELELQIGPSPWWTDAANVLAHVCVPRVCVCVCVSAPCCLCAKLNQFFVSCFLYNFLRRLSSTLLPCPLPLLTALRFHFVCLFTKNQVCTHFSQYVCVFLLYVHACVCV